MKTIIKGKMYDTETAKLIETTSHNYPGNFEWFQESLYQKKTGEFFIDGEGGASSQYAEAGATGGWIGGRKVLPLTEREAQHWVEKLGDTDLYEELWEVSE